MLLQRLKESYGNIMRTDLRLCLKYLLNWPCLIRPFDAAFLDFLMDMGGLSVLIIFEIICISISSQTSIFLTNLEKPFYKDLKNVSQILHISLRTKNLSSKLVPAPAQQWSLEMTFLLLMLGTHELCFIKTRMETFKALQ